MTEEHIKSWGAFDRGFNRYNMYVGLQFIAKRTKENFTSLNLLTSDIYINWISNSVSSGGDSNITDFEEELYKDVRTVVAIAPVVAFSGLVIHSCLKNLIEK